MIVDEVLFWFMLVTTASVWLFAIGYVVGLGIDRIRNRIEDHQASVALAKELITKPFEIPFLDPPTKLEDSIDISRTVEPQLLFLNWEEQKEAKLARDRHMNKLEMQVGIRNPPPPWDPRGQR